MKRTTIALLAIAFIASACGYQGADAQSTGAGNGRFYTDPASMLSGSGTTANPIASTLSVTSPIAGTGSAGSPVAYNLTATGGYFGTGIDGACNFDGVNSVLGIAPSPCCGGLQIYSLTRDINCTTLDVQNDVLVYGSYRVTASVSIDLHSRGWIGNSGNDASGNVAGGTRTAGSLCGGGAGATGGTGVGPNGTGGSSNMPRGFPSTAGGTGAGGAGVSAGGSAGSFGALFAASAGDLHATGFTAISTRTLNKTQMGSTCGVGGGAGGGGGVAGRLGGGSGSGAGMLVVAAPTIIGGIGEAASQSNCNVSGTTWNLCLGVLSVHGGGGGNGTNSATATGGGGGGSGGILMVVYAYGDMPGYEIFGGKGGTPGSGGGSNGAEGKTGLLIKFKVGDQ